VGTNVKASPILVNRARQPTNLGESFKDDNGHVMQGQFISGSQTGRPGANDNNWVHTPSSLTHGKKSAYGRIRHKPPEKINDPAASCGELSSQILTGRIGKREPNIWVKK
jgi:hypothetical protein